MILDIHSHKPAPYPEGVVSLDNLETPMLEKQLYSVGLHPWNSVEEISEETFLRLEKIAESPCVAAIGECGVDLLKGGPLFRQLQIFKRQIELSERLKKPLIIHCVKGADIILGLKRDLNPAQPWILHGFRGKPALAGQLTAKGIYLSFGENFNPDALREMPEDKILAETDDSILTITEIIEAMSNAAGRDLTPQIISNISGIIKNQVPF